MKVKEIIELLSKYDPEYNVVIALPPGWYKEEDVEDKDIWNKKGWTLDSVDYVLSAESEKRILICPIPMQEGIFKSYE